MIIGGMANAVWGNPRATLDVDVSIWAEAHEIASVVERLVTAFQSRVQAPLEFVNRTRVLPLVTHEGTPVDVIFAMLSYELEAIQRSVVRSVGEQPVRFCTAEDLVIMKIFSSRARDIDDVRAILQRNGKHLDHAYLEPRIRELADLLGDPEILKRYREWSPSRGEP